MILHKHAQAASAGNPIIEDCKPGENMVSEVKKRFCSTGSHWAVGEFRKIGTNRWICAACFQQRKTELRNLAKNKLLAAGKPSKR